MIDIATLARTLEVGKTYLFLGAGACVTSGAPSGPQLASLLCDRLAKGEKISDDLMEVCSILENRIGRKPLIEAVRAELRDLTPTGGLLTLPEFEWPGIFTTNYDFLVERAYAKCNRSLIVIKSNFDWGKNDNSGTNYFKIHGCLSEDIADGHRARMVLTESDYEAYADYRETLFRKLELVFVTSDVLFVGHSLKDNHLRQSIHRAAEIQKKNGAPGKIRILVFQQDPDRARLLEQRGLEVTFGGIEDLFHALTSETSTKLPLSKPSISLGVSAMDSRLPPELRSSTIEARHAIQLKSSARRMFNGAAATFADIHQDLTFERQIEARLIDQLAEKSKQYAVVIGVAGVGKTTLARRLLYRLSSIEGSHIWEHRSEFPFNAEKWILVEKALREKQERGILLIDECGPFLRQMDVLVSALARTENPVLQLILTSNTSQWVPRRKSAEFYARGWIEKLGELRDGELHSLLSLLARQPQISELVEDKFSRMTRTQQYQHLRTRCSADMYVCLKNIFATDELDTIILREYSDLHPDFQGIYKYVAALEASGTKVHRQLIMRLLDIRSAEVINILSNLEDIVEEYDITSDQGIFGWSTRHEVIAQTIAHYKFSAQDEVFELLKTVIENINPSVYIELRTIRDLCNREFGINRLQDLDRRQQLYRYLIRIAPGERVPRHRLIANLLDSGDLTEVSREIRNAEDEVGPDSVFNRYKVRLVIRRAAETAGIMPEDRRALLREAERLAVKGIDRWSTDKYSFIIYADVGVAYAETMGGDASILDESLARMRKAVEVILDPQLSDSLQSFERTRRRFAGSRSAR